jgi:GH15 family glucan-1,4-alpha-glucosidase
VVSGERTAPRLWQRSLQVIRASQTPAGGYVAAPAYPTYRYVWVRDGSFIAEAMRVAGQPQSAIAFHRFVAGAVLRSTNGAADGRRLLPARFRTDGSPDTTDWPNFQLDGYGLWLWALERQRRDTPLPPEVLEAAGRVARYLCLRWRDPCFDPWEEGGDRRPTSTLLAILGGLAAAVRLFGPGPWSEAGDDAWRDLHRLGIADGHLTKDLGDAGAVDAATLWGWWPLELERLAEDVAARTLDVVTDRLGAPAVHRHEADTFYGGGAWPVLAALWAGGQQRRGRTGEALSALAWIDGTATVAGDLPEQVAENLLAPDALEEWRARWGPVATPLVWSHAMYLLLCARIETAPDRTRAAADG